MQDLAMTSFFSQIFAECLRQVQQQALTIFATSQAHKCLPSWRLQSRGFGISTLFRRQ